MRLGKGLQALDELSTFVLVVSCRVGVVQVIQQIDTAVEFVEETTTEAKSLIQKTDWRDQGRGEDVFEPLQAWVGYWNSQQQDEMLDVLVCGKFTV